MVPLSTQQSGANSELRWDWEKGGFWAKQGWRLCSLRFRGLTSPTVPLLQKPAASGTETVLFPGKFWKPATWAPKHLPMNVPATVYLLRSLANHTSYNNINDNDEHSLLRTNSMPGTVKNQMLLIFKYLLDTSTFIVPLLIKLPVWLPAGGPGQPETASTSTANCFSSSPKQGNVKCDWEGQP